jgi:hypothetical protein
MKSLASTPFDARKVTDKRLIELITAIKPARVEHDEMLEALKLLRQDHPATVPTIKRLMSTGTPKARELVASTMNRNFSFITEARKWEDRDPEWKYRVELVWNPNGVLSLLRSWVLGNVLDETGGVYADELLLAGVDAAAHGMTTSGFPSAVKKGTESYWRGLSALYLSKVVFRADKELRARAQSKARYDFYAQVDEFVEWAGAHEDLNTVIDTAKEHKTIVVADLKDIIAQAEATPSLAKGVI